MGCARIARHADPLAAEGRDDPADRSRAGERIEDRPALFAAFEHRPDHIAGWLAVASKRDSQAATIPHEVIPRKTRGIAG